MKARPFTLLKLFSILSLTGILFIISFHVQAQDNKGLEVVQVSGLVMNQDTTYTIPGVHIYEARRGRGTVSDYKGWFSKAFLAGDTLIVSAINFKNQRIVVPDNIGDRYTLIIALEEEITQLEEVEVNPFPTEEIFKEAILAMNLSQDQRTVMEDFEPEVVRQLVQSLPMGASPEMNYRIMMNRQFTEMQNRAGPQVNPLLNPFAWAKFIQSLKKK